MQRLPFRALFSGLALGCLFSGAAIADAADELRALLAQTHAFKSHFEQRTLDSSERLLSETSGELWLQRPRRFRIEVGAPFPETMVSDGETWWIFDHDLEQVMVRKLAEHAADIPVLLLTDDTGDLLARFSVAVHPGDAAKVYSLSPIGSAALYDSIELTFRGPALHRIEVADALGKTTHIEFGDSEINPELATELFEFTAPAGIDVIKDS